MPKSTPSAQIMQLYPGSYYRLNHVPQNLCWIPNTQYFRMWLWFIVQLLSCVWLFANPWTAARQASLYFTISQSLPNSCPLRWWCYPTISSSVTPFSSCPWPFPASGSFPVTSLFASGGQSTGVSASASVLPMNIQGWFPLGSIGLILQSKGLSRVFASTTVQKYQFFGAQSSLWSNS